MNNANEQKWAEQTKGWNAMARLFLYRRAGVFGRPMESKKPVVTKKRPYKFGQR